MEPDEDKMDEEELARNFQEYVYLTFGKPQTGAGATTPYVDSETGAIFPSIEDCRTYWTWYDQWLDPKDRTPHACQED